MKKGLIGTLFIAAIVMLTVAACNQSNVFEGSSGGPDFVGTWEVNAGGGNTQTWVFTTTSITVTGTGLLSGNLSCSITSYDTAASHIRATATSSGSPAGFSGVTSGNTVYIITYSVGGSQLFVSYNTSSYPLSAANGPYTKQ